MVILLGLNDRNSSRKQSTDFVAVGYNRIRISTAKTMTLALLRMTWHQARRQLSIN